LVTVDVARRGMVVIMTGASVGMAALVVVGGGVAVGVAPNTGVKTTLAGIVG
jgi:hypothetical protein